MSFFPRGSSTLAKRTAIRRRSQQFSLVPFRPLPPAGAVYSTSSLFQVDSIIFSFRQMFGAPHRRALGERQDNFGVRRTISRRIISAILIPPSPMQLDILIENL